MDYFSLFNLPHGYTLDLADLAVRYQRLQRQCHPDRFAAAPEREKRLALQQATTVNTAYQTLKHPLDRAEYLLSKQGVEMNDERNTLKNNDFLKQQMALRERMAEIEQQPKAHEDFLAFSDQIDKMTSQQQQQLALELDQQQWLAAADRVWELRFLDKLRQQLEQLEQRLLNC